MPRNSNDGLPDLGRFANPAVLILSSLADGDKHGYALIQDIETFADVALGPGTLYGALTRLERHGLIEALAVDQRRRPYRLTATGAAALTAYLRHARTVTTVGLRRLAGA
ncbi:MAG TPA: PadR family transcriptional regulator [Pseudonocardiaceae bacterium]